MMLIMRGPSSFAKYNKTCELLALSSRHLRSNCLSQLSLRNPREVLDRRSFWSLNSSDPPDHIPNPEKLTFKVQSNRVICPPFHLIDL